ncbi:Major facilitator superfamily domain, general substrate transporter [Akanthomyces lecanii RCEF 1005]|uniref:Major facilitator superfamily domain, general substrate transporter n=1 Tax=Akanthomyces lecanii RCEF 1005 TaxID=1081108 RepID=A0A162N516_CORDF|nr:Major facilitator superfamily domain, general substrate transporter [Akanthomyces lecanii RCEF 1005]
MDGPRLLDSSSTPVFHSDSNPAALYKRLLNGPSHSQIEFEKTLIGSLPGVGTEVCPFLVNFVHNDPFDPMNLPPGQRWAISALVAIGALIVTFSSSAYNGGILDLIAQFRVSREVAIAGVSLYVLGFAVGPLLWAPLSEIHGRRGVFVVSFAGMTVFTVGAASAGSMAALLVLRFLTGATGASVMTNGPGVIADIFDASQRGLATGPIIGGFLGEAEGWRWLQGLMAILSGVITLLGIIFINETYTPVLLRQRAERLSRLTDKVYISALDAGQPPATPGQKLKAALIRPWIFLFREPIVLIASIYVVIVYGTMYLNFAAYPIVFQRGRGWGIGLGGVAFTGTAIGVVLATIAAYVDYKHYIRIQKETKKNFLPPEYRLRSTIVGSFLVPIGLFWFAWTSQPSIHWIVPIIGSVFFSCGLVMVFMSLLNYLIDSYVVFAASVMAANSVLRSVFGAAFPLFTIDMYENLGLQWAGSIPGFLALACIPFPLIFYLYGARIRMKCKFAAEAAHILDTMMKQSAAAKAEATPPANEEANKDATLSGPESESV